MIACEPAATTAANGGRSRARSSVQRRVDGGQLEVRVGDRGAVPGEVLGAGGHPGRLQAR